MSWVRHSGGCHCGKVRFEVLAPAKPEVLDCNCSICSKTGFLHLIVSKASFKLVSGGDALTAYTFNTGTAKHLFCWRLRHQIVLRAALASRRLQRECALPRRADPGHGRQTHRRPELGGPIPRRPRHPAALADIAKPPLRANMD